MGMALSPVLVRAQTTSNFPVMPTSYHNNAELKGKWYAKMDAVKADFTEYQDAIRRKAEAFQEKFDASPVRPWKKRTHEVKKKKFRSDPMIVDIPEEHRPLIKKLFAVWHAYQAQIREANAAQKKAMHGARSELLAKAKKAGLAYDRQGVYDAFVTYFEKESAIDDQFNAAKDIAKDEFLRKLKEILF